MVSAQDGVGTFSDLTLVESLAKLEQLDPARPWEDTLAQFAADIQELRLFVERLQGLLARRAQGRFVDFRERGAAASDVGTLDLIASQGAVDCMQWKGLPLFKTAYDVSLYSMLLWALKPRVVIELGSGSGASAIWMADLLRTFGAASHVYSIDVRKPDQPCDGVTFIEGDCRDIGAVFEEAFIRSAPHPWLLVEDAHVNVSGVLTYFDAYLTAGDYLIVEDSSQKRDVLERFLIERPGRYKVDTYYTDFFGRNATCAQDSILVRM